MRVRQVRVPGTPAASFTVVDDRHRRVPELTGGRITITALAREAGVSPSYLHTQRDVITELAQLRQRPTDADTKRSTSNASHAALLRRLDLTSRRARELAAQYRDLRAELAMAYGQLRNAEQRLRDLDTQDRH